MVVEDSPASSSAGCFIQLVTFCLQSGVAQVLVDACQTITFKIDEFGVRDACVGREQVMAEDVRCVGTCEVG